VAVLTENAKPRLPLAGTFIKNLMSIHVGLEVVNSVDHQLYKRLKRIPPKSRTPASGHDGSGVVTNRGQEAGDNNIQQAGTISRTRKPG
jgi:hypothetical protein